MTCSLMWSALLLAGCNGQKMADCAMPCAPAAAWTELALLAGQPGGQGWVDGPARSAHFQGPYGLAFDGADHLYLADDSLVRDFELSSKKLRTIAGRLGTGGDDGIGAEAAFFHPTGMVVADGTLFLSDTENHSLRMIDAATGKVSTLAGQTGILGHDDGIGTEARFQEPEGLAWDRSEGQLYISDTDNHTIRKLDLQSRAVTTVAGMPMVSGADDGVGSAARFSKPGALALDEVGRALFISDAANLTIRRMALDDALVSTLASLPDAPRSLAMDGSEVLAGVGPEIISISAATGAMHSLAGSSMVGGFVDGVGEDARFGAPAGIAADGNGGAFIADATAHAVRRLDLSSRAVTTFVGTISWGAVDGKGESARFAKPQGLVAAAGGLLYVADTENHAIRTVAIATGKVTTLAGALGEAGHADGRGAAARFNRPSGLAFDGTRYLYIAELGNADLRRLDLSSTVVSTLTLTSAPADAEVKLTAPLGLAFDRGHLYATESARILAVDLAKKEVSVLAKDPGASQLFAALSGIVADGRGQLLVADVLKNSVLQVTIDTGAVTTFIGTVGFGANRLHYPSQLVRRTDGTLFVADARTIRQVAMDGTKMKTIVGTLDGQGVKPGRLPAQLGEPTAMALSEEGLLAVVAENSILVVR